MTSINDICKQLLVNPQDAHFWCWSVTGDRNLIYFHNLNERNQWLYPTLTAELAVKQGHFKQIMCNFEGLFCTLCLSQRVV